MIDITEENIKNAKITAWDKTYCELLEKILKEGERFENRTGIDTFSIEGVNFKLNVGEEFPILESKKVFVKNALTELLWIYQAQSNDVSWLRERGNNIWNEWEIDKDGYWTAIQNVPNDDGTFTKKEIKKFFGKEYAGTIGTAYGWINNKFKRPQTILETLKKNPNDRRMVMSLWQDEYLNTAVLPSCVWSSEWKVNRGKLNAYVHQRSADVPIGLPFNVTQYAILLSLFAKVSNLEVGNLNWSIMDAHIYENQLQEVKLQLQRYKYMEKFIRIFQILSLEDIKKTYSFYKNEIDYYENKYKFKEQIPVLEHLLQRKDPKLVIADKDDFFLFDNSEHNKDIKLENYSSLPFIRMKVTK